MKQRDKNPVGDDIGAASADGRVEPPVSRKKSRGGAPFGNTNAATDPDFVLNMRKAKVQAKKKTARIRRESAARTDATLTALKLSDHPLALRLGARLTSLDVKIIETNGMADKLPKTLVGGAISPMYALAISLEREDRAEIMKMLTMLSEIMAGVDGDSAVTTEQEAREKIWALSGRFPGALDVHIKFSDGSDASMGFTGAARLPVAADLAAGDAAALAAPRALPAPHTTLLDAHPLDVAAPKGEPTPVSKPYTVETSIVETEEQKRYRDWAAEMDDRLDD